MTPTHTDTPLRRSEVGALRTPVQTPVINDDEEERRQARRRTAIEDSTASSTIEDNETLKNCLKIYNENKLSKENAWSVSLIDTLSTLMDKHHKSLNNFKVAGSSLEASSKVYGLRVDSIHTDVVRMSSGLNKQKIVEEDENDDQQHDTSSIGQEQPSAENQQKQDQHIKKPKKRVRKAISTITKNKETLNGRIDTNPFSDPIFAKLNSIAGSINSSNRLLQNILPSADSELGLRMDKLFWDSNVRDPISYPMEYNYTDCKSVDAKAVENIILEGCLLRPNHSGYIISDTPAEQDEASKDNEENFDNEPTHSQLAVAFDINADVEPIPADTHTFVDVDMGELEELTIEEQAQINNCKGLRRAPILIEDLRPLDSTSSNLEYSYRPLDKISQFWAGPSHWKFKKSRGKSLSIAQRLSSNQPNEKLKAQNSRGRRRAMKYRSQHVNFGETHDDLFQKLDGKSKLKKANIQKKWDAKKLKLPTDLQVDRNIFDIFRYAPGIRVHQEIEETLSPDIPIQSEYDYHNPVDQEYCSNNPDQDDYTDTEPNAGLSQDEDCNPNQTVVEIATDFIGAPDKVTKIIVPFAKRAKVIDMKQLKKCCMQLINNQFRDTEKENIPKLSEFEDDKYKNGIASFTKVYKSLPQMLTQNMNEALSPSVAFYSILHLANESNLRLLSQKDLTDFQIVQLDL